MIKDIKAEIAPLRNRLLTHSLYNNINNPDDLRLFLEYHVFAVWDFMSLLKALQQKLTCTTTPWIPTGKPELRYLINEIVLAEETDNNKEGKHQSHYEMYLEAMEECGANTSRIENFIADLLSLKNILVDIKLSELPPAVKDFLNFTFFLIEEGKPHKIASAFTFGREDLIPEMFTAILREMRQNFPELHIDKLVYYFERHIELDQDEHGPMALQMVTDLCEDNEQQWKEAEETAITALQMRIALWDTIEEEIIKARENSLA
ncbi:DUF3050 domain-containing protein [Sinomicrobium weinanense]|uniref:DUF3050 domain-containing protein n=1 Tax=Sinomicrobium weinanense TaxID=2842200 RepID=A0A926JQ30_9FLAO|nr:DUF3050 domain-containing protein [Sinomicrobium weinanense]MBC9795171.1 DUF3050 domain-containing protein [Sinomicrobium weinanense]MBU3121948.1 DUF3050 domain-containing protein [Sinomicrobium weinanense]